MRCVADRKLSEPFRAWIDRGKPLPMGVTLLPRRIDVPGAAWALLCVALPCLSLAAIIGALSHAFLVNMGSTALFVLFCSILLGVPIWTAHRLWRTIDASRDQKVGALRQGLFVGPEGILLRLVPNRCYPIPMERFVKAEAWSGGGSDGGEEYTRIATLDGPIDFVEDHLTVFAAEVNQAVAAARSRPAASSEKPPAGA